MQLQVLDVGTPSQGLPSPDVYFTMGYGTAEETTGHTWVLLANSDGSFQIPLLIRDDGVARDAMSPYGYSGAYADPMLGRAELRELWDESREALHDLGVVSLFLRHSALVPQAPLPDDTVPVLSDHPTCVVDISDLDRAWASMEGRARTAIRKAERLGVTAAVGPAALDDLLPGSDFSQLYEATMARRQAASHYFFSPAYYSALHAGLGDRLWLGKATDKEGRAVAAALFMRHGPFLHYHLSGSALDANSLGASNLLLWRAAQRAAADGGALFHLGGGVKPGDSLYRFKRSFGGRHLPFEATGLVIDRTRFDRLTRYRSRILGVDAPALSARFFPPYRVEDFT